MNRAFSAELARLLRRRVLLGTALAVLVFGVLGARIVLTVAKPAREVTGGGRPSIESLSSSGGGTEIFRFAASFAGTLVFVVFVGLFALEFARGTYRTMLLRQPLRIRLLAGKMAALLCFVGAVLAATEIVMWLAARLLASGADVATIQWASVGSLGDAFADYAMVLLWVTGYAVLGMTVAVLLRSVPLALAVGIAWAGPIEHLVGDAWPTASKVFPGLLLEIVGQGGTDQVSVTRASLTVAAYILAAAVITSIVFARRDVSS
jgi:ABC-2 type transport system permease protein